MNTGFTDKDQARQAVWDRLVAERVAAFPFPPHGRIPNFKGAKAAATRLFTLPPLHNARHLKVNPDAPQRFVREEALRRGITVLVPTPRLRGGFNRLDPHKIPEAKIREAASLSRGARWSDSVSLGEFPPVDAIVAGSVAVTRDGRRCGKGEGYSDIEFAILRELGHSAVPVVTTVHACQIVEALPSGPTDLPLSWIVTADEVIEVVEPALPPAGIHWDLLTAGELDEMPILRELQALRRSGAP